MDALVWQSLMLGLVCLHLHNEVHKMLWLGEEFELLSIDKVSKFILNLNNELNNVEAIESVVGQRRLEGDGCFLSGSEIALNNGQHVLFNFIAGLQGESVLLIHMLLPESNLVVRLELNWHQVGGRVEAKMTLEVSCWHVINVVAWCNHLWEVNGLSSEQSLS